MSGLNSSSEKFSANTFVLILESPGLRVVIARRLQRIEHVVCILTRDLLRSRGQEPICRLCVRNYGLKMRDAVDHHAQQLITLDETARLLGIIAALPIRIV